MIGTIYWWLLEQVHEGSVIVTRQAKQLCLKTPLFPQEKKKSRLRWDSHLQRSAYTRQMLYQLSHHARPVHMVISVVYLLSHHLILWKCIECVKCVGYSPSKECLHKWLSSSNSIVRLHWLCMKGMLPIPAHFQVSVTTSTLLKTPYTFHSLVLLSWATEFKGLT